MSEGPPQNRLLVWAQALRVYQWTKNLLLFAALIFAKEFTHPDKVFVATLAFAAFCLCASAAYIFNDLLDIEKDRRHPKKRHRPLASGAISSGTAAIAGLTLGAAGLLLGGFIGPRFLGALVFYVALTLSYSVWLKHFVLVDVLALALGFVVRAMAGAIAISVQFSNWLIVCTFFLATFLTLCKRRNELTLLEDNAESHRRVLFHYSVHYLDQLILIAAGGALITYTIYTCSPEVIQRLGTDKLYMTLPFVVYGIFRYLFVVHQLADGGDPSRVLLKDWPLLACVVLWALSCGLILYVA